MPILMQAIMSGLSMDYEMFLPSWVRERYDITGDNTTAVVGGFQRTGGVITSLALVLIVMVGVFSAPGGRFIKLTGIGMIVGAFIAGVLLVPVMTAQDSVPGSAGESR
jgi:RND superfamily putative drug exporter